jgi:hypothetical protein
MKKLSLTALFLAAAAPLLYADSGSVWATLDTQATSMAQAVDARNVSSLGELNRVIGDEVTGLRRDPTLSKELSPLLDEIAKQAAATFHAAHDNDWKSADTDQQAFAHAVQAATAAATGKNG